MFGIAYQIALAFRISGRIRISALPNAAFRYLR